MIRLRIIFITTVAATAFAVSAWAGDSQVGLRLAARYCDVCHGVERSLNPPNLAPPILDLAARANGDEAWLRAWLNPPHPALQTALSREQVDDIVAYLARLTKSTR
jgi:mono/diheme cytochrome c family protein